MTVYVLENGCYSDTHIVGIFSTREAADMAARIFTDDANISEYEVDSQIEMMKRGGMPYFVRLNRQTGDVIEVERRSSSYGAFSSDVGEDIHKNLYTHCWALTDADAVKIAADRRRMFLALAPLQDSDAVDPHASK